MTKTVINTRKSVSEVDPLFPGRWSPRAFSGMSVEQKQLIAIFEAARWTPSCYNEQPWLFIYAVSPEDRKRFSSVLAEKNRTWAGKAPVLVFALAKLVFDSGGRANRHASFDTGAAWMSMTLQARKFGLFTHAMAGFDIDKAYETLAVPRDKYDILAGITIGYMGDPASLTPDLKEIETPNERKPLPDVYREGSYTQT